MKQVFLILGDIVKNRNLQIFYGFRFFMMSTIMINANLSQVYLTNDVILTYS